MNILRSELFRKKEVIEAAPKNEFKWNYAMGGNLDKIQKELNALERGREPGEDFRQFEREKVELGKKMAKQKDGQPMVVYPPGSREGIFVIDDQNQAEASKQLDLLREKHKEAIEKQQKLDQGYIDSLKENVDINFFYVQPEWVPNIAPKDMAPIVDMITMDSKDWLRMTIKEMKKEDVLVVLQEEGFKLKK